MGLSQCIMRLKKPTPPPPLCPSYRRRLSPDLRRPSVQTNCIGTQPGASVSAPGYNTSQLQAPTGYTDMYLNWNLDLDGVGDLDYPWNFGTSSDYPTLNTPAQSTAVTPAATDYDTNDDGLIEISNLAQLNAIRWDLNGDGDPETVNFNAYGTAFGGRDTTTAGRMGCPSETCTGYELRADLNFDTDGSGIANSGDTYWNGGSGWVPLGSDANAASRYQARFRGNDHTIDKLFINRSGGSGNAQGLFGGVHSNARVELVGVTTANVTANAN